jgi:hypothetical protein
MHACSGSIISLPNTILLEVEQVDAFILKDNENARPHYMHFIT